MYPKIKLKANEKLQTNKILSLFESKASKQPSWTKIDMNKDLAYKESSSINKELLEVITILIKYF